MARSFADYGARMMLMKRGEFDYAYNAQACTDEGHGVIVAGDLTNEASDTGHLPGMVEEVRELRDELGLGEKKETVVTADRDYFSVENIKKEGKGVELLIASGREGNTNDDLIINVSDFGRLAVAYMTVTGNPSFDPGADFDRNGVINISDFGLLSVNFLRVSPVTVSPEKTWNLKRAHAQSVTSYYHVWGHETWAQNVEKATGGRVKVTIYPNQTLLSAIDAYEGVKSGIADVAWIAGYYFPVDST